MIRSSVSGIVAALCTAAAVIFAGVGATELSYVSDHPYAYGPAKVIAWAAGAGVLLSAAVGVLAVSARSR
jgi:hypothetical protein